MDTTRDIIFRGFKLNDSNIQASLEAGNGIDDGLSGSVVDNVHPTDTDIVQFVEKRSLEDGMDVGDVYLGGRRVRITGTLYGKSRPALFDLLQSFRRAMSPTLAQREDPPNKGYAPLYYAVPTLNPDFMPAGAIALQVKAMARGYDYVIDRDGQGGEDLDAIAIPWQAVFYLRDPRQLSELPVDVTFPATVEADATAATTDIITSSGHGLAVGDRIYFTSLTGGTGLSLNTAYYVRTVTATTFKVATTNSDATVRDITVAYTAMKWTRVFTQAGTLTNRGDYHATLNFVFSVGPQAGTITMSVGGSNLTITLPASAGNRTVRYSGGDKVLTILEDVTELLRMDVLSFQNKTTHPLITGGPSPYSVTVTGAKLLSGGHMWFWESFA